MRTHLRELAPVPPVVPRVLLTPRPIRETVPTSSGSNVSPHRVASGQVWRGIYQIGDRRAHLCAEEVRCAIERGLMT